MKRLSQDLRHSIHKGGDNVSHEQGCRTDSQRVRAVFTCHRCRLGAWLVSQSGLGWGQRWDMNGRKIGSHLALESSGLHLYREEDQRIPHQEVLSQPALIIRVTKFTDTESRRVPVCQGLPEGKMESY